MRTTFALDDELFAKAQNLTGVKGKRALVREALRALIERESKRRLARLGSTEPDLAAAPRRQPAAKEVRLNDLLDAITPENRHTPSDLGPPVGKEDW